MYIEFKLYLASVASLHACTFRLHFSLFRYTTLSLFNVYVYFGGMYNVNVIMLIIICKISLTFEPVVGQLPCRAA